ncbi:glycosyltransferase family 4 protein [Candidatus Gracilibacteria bacterium]|nr:glycosyltransferase family 4 protein [Candidatus Gracilibacteria bacterium]
MKHCQVSAQKIIVVNNDITFIPDTKGYKELDKGKNILFVGRIFPQKGLEFLLDTAQKVIGIDPQVKFLIGGDGIMIPQVVQSIAERELEKNVLLTGWVNSSVKKQLYKSGDLFVMPSPSEPFGLTALEAIKSGVPVISSKHCGFLDVVPSTPTFEYYDTHKFAEMILHYIDNKKILQNLLQTQQKELSKHKWPDQIAKILQQI